MGQIVNVVERPSSRPGIVRFETDRALSGMGHDRYVAGQVIDDDRPVDELARRIFARGGVQSVHINGNVITVDLQKGYTADGIADIVRGLYTFYVATPMEAPDAVAAEAAVAAAPDEQRAADAPVLQEIAAADEAGVARPADAGEVVAERNEALMAEAEASAADAAKAEVAGADAAGDDEPLEAETEGHGEVVEDTDEAPHEAEGTVRPAEVEQPEPPAEPTAE